MMQTGNHEAKLQYLGAADKNLTIQQFLSNSGKAKPKQIYPNNREFKYKRKHNSNEADEVRRAIHTVQRMFLCFSFY